MHLYLATLSKSNFNFHYVIGRGGFGKVSFKIWENFRRFSLSEFLLRVGMEGRVQEEHASLRYERDVKGPDHLEAVCHVSHEREEASLQVAASIPSQY